MGSGGSDGDSSRAAGLVGVLDDKPSSVDLFWLLRGGGVLLAQVSLRAFWPCLEVSCGLSTIGCVAFEVLSMHLAVGMWLMAEWAPEFWVLQAAAEVVAGCSLGEPEMTRCAGRGGDKGSESWEELARQGGGAVGVSRRGPEGQAAHAIPAPGWWV